ncbi:MAG: hypothetical protein IPJ94_24250 [Chloroflexi bacterium]|nr:hypothetical protein [Chloroflexota bacterium]
MAIYKKKQTRAKGKTSTQVLQWAKKQHDSGVPLMIVWNEIMNSTTLEDGADVILAHTRAGDEIFNAMFGRNQEGQKLESEGRIDEAIGLYEKNVTDQFIGLHPYERLRVIYTQRKDYNAAIRVCQSYINLPRDSKQQSSSGKRSRACSAIWISYFKNSLEWYFFKVLTAVSAGTLNPR